MHILRFLLFPAFLFSAFHSQSQVNSVSELDDQYLNWYEQDPLSKNKVGCSVERAYAELIKDKAPKKTVIVAVLDSGVDIEHPELKDKIWTNEGEIAGNGIDDDGNGYIDDIHGWNFLGAADGTNVLEENLELTRIIRDYGPSHPQYERASKQYEKDLAEQQEDQKNLIQFAEIYNTCITILLNENGVRVQNAEDLKAVVPISEAGEQAKGFLSERYGMGLTEEGLTSMLDRNREYMHYYLNKGFDARKVIGDNPDDLSDRSYGNPDVKGGNSDHGTSVAGVIAAERTNNKGINGISQHALIMPVRTTPNGDERDKDVALGIIYAVDNGADIINMSFGKSFSPHPEFIEEATKYAQEHGVLLVHSAGNSGLDIDTEASFPKGRFADGSEASNWICIGASSPEFDKELPAIFSNYGETQVDLFAPGVNIISTDTTNTYNMSSGTSVASPVVSGIAAMLLSYYPELSPEEIIDILMDSAYEVKKPKKVYLPGRSSAKRKKVKFASLSRQGGIVNAYNALLEAESRSKQLN